MVSLKGSVVVSFRDNKPVQSPVLIDNVFTLLAKVIVDKKTQKSKMSVFAISYFSWCDENSSF